MTISHVHVTLLCTQCLYMGISSSTIFSYLLMSPCQYSCSLSSLINWFNKDAKANHAMACKTKKKLSSTAMVDIYLNKLNNSANGICNETLKAI